MTPQARRLLCLVVLLLGSLQTAMALARSLIPYEMNGTLQEVRSVTDSRQKLFEIQVDGRNYETDNKAVSELRVGRHLQKDRWSVVLVIDGKRRDRLPIGRETYQFAILTVLAVAGTWLLTIPVDEIRR